MNKKEHLNHADNPVNEKEVVEGVQSPEDIKVEKLRHGMTIRIGFEVFKVFRTSRKSVTLKFLGVA